MAGIKTVTTQPMHMPFLKNRYRFLGHFVLSISDGRKFEFLVNLLLMESGRLYKLKHKDRMETYLHLGLVEKKL